LGALSRLTKIGMMGDAELVFYDDGGTYETELGELLRAGLAKGQSHAHNRLVQLAGSDRIHGEQGMFKRHQMPSTILKRAFDSASWADLGQARGLRRAPRILVRRNNKSVELPQALGKPLERCDQEACTSIEDMARAMCLLTQHARLPSSRRLPLGMGDNPSNLALLKQALMRPKRHTPGHVEYAFMQKLSTHRGYTLYRRSGRADGWSSFVMGVSSSKGRRDYVVAMAAHGERRPLEGVAQVLAGLLKAEDL